MHTRRKRSSIWNHFTQVNSEGSKCSHCEKVVSTKSGSTGNLSRHIKRKHPLLKFDLKERLTPESDPNPNAVDELIASTASIAMPVSGEGESLSLAVFQEGANGSQNSPMVIGFYEEVQASEVLTKDTTRSNLHNESTSNNQKTNMMNKRRRTLEGNEQFYISTGEAVDMARKFSSTVTTKEEIFARFVASEMEELKKNPVLYTETKVAILDILRNSQLQLIHS